MKTSLNLAVALVLLSGCSGILVLPAERLTPCDSSADCGIGRVCDAARGLCVPSAGPCSQEHPSGDCPSGLTCSGGYCLCLDPARCNCPGGVCQTTWCDCEPEQGCDNGICYDITADNACAPDRPDGLCPDNRACCEGGDVCCPEGEVCVGDHCVPNTNPCSPDILDGWCENGLSCIGGRCVPTASYPCSEENPAGACLSGFSCQGGFCLEIACAPGVLGVCSRDMICGPLGCELLPCSVDHTSGACASGTFCSQAGSCIATGTCLVALDCPSPDGQYCATSLECLQLGTCEVDDDCEALQDDVFGQGYYCESGTCAVRTLCDDDAQCLPDQICSGGDPKRCLTPPACDVTSDCGDGFFCGSDGNCLADGTCLVSDDCETGSFCSGGTPKRCLVPPACDVTADCPPEQTCASGTCAPINPGSCSSNTIVNTGCADPDAFDCCESGETCCYTGDVADKRCSAAENCIPLGRCVGDSDCLESDTSCVDYVCVPNTACDSSYACPSGQRCSTRLLSGTWIVGCIADDRCLSKNDCPAGEYCASDFRCRPSPTCGAESYSAGSTVAPNVLMVVDRSGSMNLCGPGDPMLGPCGYNNGPCEDNADCTVPGDTCNTYSDVCYDPDCAQGQDISITTTRWEETLAAIDDLLDDYGTRANFGLSLFPPPAPVCTLDSQCHPDLTSPCDGHCTDGCTLSCNWYGCTGSGFYPVPAGVLDVEISGDAAARNQAILDALAATAPGGSTPTAPTLRNIIASTGMGGLDDPGRANAVLLFTDGEATGDTADLNLCAPPCADGVKNGDETGVDCGGSCDPCVTGYACLEAADCTTHVCRAGFCREATCTNGVMDETETDLDCGGDCGPCPDGLACLVPGDCASKRCGGDSLCALPTCEDEIKNGDETDLDCGGSCHPCTTGSACLLDGDCVSSVCQASICRAASCGNGAQDAGETGVDCGGPCAPCPTLCQNGVQDGDETDVDCGGSCPDCGPYRACALDADCLGDAAGRCALYEFSATPQATYANAAIGRLYSSSPRVRTFVVGFNLGTTSANLNCHAVYGRTARQDTPGCAALTTADCAASPDTCYYEANDAASLGAAFEEILTEVSACSYDVSALTIPNTNLVYVYLEDGAGVRTRVERGVAWELITGETKRLDFYDQACELLRAGGLTPVVVIGCPTSG